MRDRKKKTIASFLSHYTDKLGVACVCVCVLANRSLLLSIDL